MKRPAVERTPQLTDGFCCKNHLRWVALFPLLLRDEFIDDKDIEVLVACEQGVSAGLRDF